MSTSRNESVDSDDHDKRSCRTSGPITFIHARVLLGNDVMARGNRNY